MKHIHPLRTEADTTAYCPGTKCGMYRRECTTYEQPEKEGLN